MEKLEKNKSKSRLCLILVLFFIFISLSAVPVCAMTKQQVNSKITTLQKEVNALEKQYKSAKTSEKSQTAGLTPVFGSIKCQDPFILETVSGVYYWVNQPGNLVNEILFASGYVQKTGNYRVYNEITCVECNAVKVAATDKAASINKKLTKKKNTLKKYKDALKTKIILPSKKTVFIGKTEKISYYWKNGRSYNNLTWKSSNNEVAAVDQNGKITAKSKGQATITAKADISGKVSKCVVTVQQRVTNLSFEQESYDISSKSLENGYYDIRLNIMPDTEDDKISIKSSDNNIVSFVSRDGNDVTLEIKNPGKATITAKTKSGVKAKCVINYLGNMVNSISFAQEKYQALYEDGVKFIEIYVSLDDPDKEMDDNLDISSTNTDVAVFDEYRSNGNKLAFEILDVGTTTITVESSSGVKASCLLEVTDQYGLDYNDDYYYLVNDSNVATANTDIPYDFAVADSNTVYIILAVPEMVNGIISSYKNDEYNSNEMLTSDVNTWEYFENEAEPMYIHTWVMQNPVPSDWTVSLNFDTDTSYLILVLQEKASKALNKNSLAMGADYFCRYPDILNKKEFYFYRLEF